MIASQLPFFVEGLIVFAAALFGIFLGRKGKPYGKVKLSFHLFFFLWFTLGYGFIATSVFSTGPKPLTALCVTMLGLGTLTQLVTGIRMLAKKTVGSTLPRVHALSVVVMLLADLGAFFVVAG